MNWKLIVLLGLTGPLLAIAGNYGLVGFSTEPYLVFAFLIIFSIIFSFAKTGRYFLHGFIAAMLFGLSMSYIRLTYLQQYINANPDAIDKGEDLLHKFHYIRSPMIIIGCMILISSVICGILTWIGSVLIQGLRKSGTASN